MFFFRLKVSNQRWGRDMVFKSCGWEVESGDFDDRYSSISPVHNLNRIKEATNA